MLKKKALFWQIACFLLCLSMLPSWADIDLVTAVPDVFYRASCGRIGTIKFSVNGNDFAEATPQQPVYVRIRMDHLALNCRDMVRSDGDLTPVLLPLRVEVPGYEVAADPTTVQIVRWRQGEPEIWLRVTQSTNLWLRKDGDLRAPSRTVPVAFHLGLNLEDYLIVYRQAFESGEANLPFPTRELNRDDIIASPGLDTPLEMDLRSSNLVGHENTDDIHESTLQFDPIAFDHQTLGVETESDFSGIRLGQLSSVGFSNDRMIARATIRDAGETVPALEWLTTARDFNYRGACERTGYALFEVVNNGFPDASEESPAYIRLALNRGARLCETKVAPGGDPIYLALYLEGQGNDPLLDVPKNALSIVRWVEGERAVWLKLTAGTSTWLRSGEQQVPPSRDFPVRTGLLVSAIQSFEASRDFFIEGRANLPFNTTNLLTDGSLADAVDTQLLADVRSSSFEPLPAPLEFSTMRMEPIALGEGTSQVETASDESLIILGEDLRVSSEHPVIGRAFQLFPDQDDVVRLETTVRDVFEDGICELTGQMRFRISGDVFPNATAEEPAYVRLRLSGGAVLCETLVDTQANNGSPIYLALRVLPVPHVDVQVVAPPDTLEIVRWKRGENEIWLKVTTETSRWIRYRESIGPPNTRDIVEFVLANSAVDSYTSNHNSFLESRANLAGNTRNPNNVGDFESVVDTFMGMDLTSFVLPTPSFIEFNADAFDHTTAGVETAEAQNQIVLGDLVPMQLAGDLQIARTQTDLPLRVSPDISVQGLEVITLDAILPDDIEPTSIRWENMSSGALLSEDFSLAYDPLPGRTVRLRVTARDVKGREGEAFAVILVNPEGLDLNGDGKNTVEDLRQVTDQWSPQSKSVLDLLHIRIDPEP